MAIVAVNPPHAAVRISASVVACVEVVCAVAGDVDFVTTPNAGRIASKVKPIISDETKMEKTER